MTRVRCLTMQKNEATHLEPWLLWHGALFGCENLTVIDNGSTDTHVISVLERYEQQGVTVVRDHGTQEDFVRKGDIMIDLIQKMDAIDPADFNLPMDCDEFLALCLDRLSVRREDILAGFESLKNEKATLITDRLLLNVPGWPGYYRPQCVQRALFRAHTALGLDHGFHTPVTPWPEKCVRTPFVYLHLHNRPDYEDILRFARQKLAHIRGAVPDDGATVEEVALARENPEGYHLRYYFSTDSDTFLRAYRDVPNIYAPLLDQHLRTLGIDPAPLLGTADVPRPSVTVPPGFLAHRTIDHGRLHEFTLFDPLYYAHANADVTRDAYYGIWPLIHFMDAGWRENRPPNPENLPPLRIITPNPLPESL